MAAFGYFVVPLGLGLGAASFVTTDPDHQAAAVVAALAAGTLLAIGAARLWMRHRSKETLDG